MNTRAVLFSVILSVLFSSARSTIPDDKKQIGATCLTEMFSTHFDRAQKIADSLTAADKTDPLGLTMQLAVIGMRSIDLDTLLDSLRFCNLYNEVNSRICQARKQQGTTSYLLLLEGFSGALNASFLLKQERYFTGFSTGLTALKKLDSATNLDPSNLDALYFPSLYTYVKDELRKTLKFLLFWYPSSREKSVADLSRIAAAHSMTSLAAQFALVDIYSRDKHPTAHDELVGKIMVTTNESRFALWAKAKLCTSLERTLESADLYRRLAESYEHTEGGTFNALTTRFLLAQALFKLGQKSAAASECQTILLHTQNDRNKVILNDTKSLLKRITHEP